MLRAPKGHMNIRIPHSGSGAKAMGIPKTMICRILVLVWSFGPLMLHDSSYTLAVAVLSRVDGIRTHGRAYEVCRGVKLQPMLRALGTTSGSL